MNNFPEFERQGYQVEKELGSNRTGGRVTYLARVITSQQPVVIKQFQFVKSDSSWSDYDAHEREIEVLQGLKNPGIPRYLDSFETPDSFCMVQEYKHASSLGMTRSFNADDLKQIAVALLEILIYLQNRIPPVIHRDIKPENILVDKHLNVYLVDFGFARIGDGEIGISSVVKGTLGFMPPEQIFNHQITESSDIYSLGMTLICLLTATKSNQIGQLVDINYRVSFKHLVPKLNFQWVKWLEKMVEPRFTHRYPNAIAALEAIPTHPMRLPQAKISHINLELTATKFGENLTQVITVNNAVPETMLTGRWEVAAHLSDPPHNPNYHSWISVEPIVFESNQAECKITVDTSKLMAGKIFIRQLLLHTNSLPETYYLNLQIKTAPIPIRTKKLPVSFLSLQFLLSLMMSWIISWSIVISGTLAGDSATAGLGTAAGAAVGMQAAAWAMSAAGMKMGATVIAVAGAALGIMALAMAWVGTLAVAGKVAIVGAAVGIMGGLIIGIVTGIAVENLIRRRLSKEFALWLSLLTSAAGSSFGLCLGTGFLNPLILGAMALTSLPFAATLIYLPLRKVRLIGDYRQAEQHLIKP